LLGPKNYGKQQHQLEVFDQVPHDLEIVKTFENPEQSGFADKLVILTDFE